MIDLITAMDIGDLARMVVIAYAIVFLYSIYMAYLAWKQAKVKNLLEETNELLNKILEVLNDKRT